MSGQIRNGVGSGEGLRLRVNFRSSGYPRPERFVAQGRTSSAVAFPIGDDGEVRANLVDDIAERAALDTVRPFDVDETFNAAVTRVA